jgi:dipeptidyl aminopeptidase/acylaminoacyl peptidase
VGRVVLGGAVDGGRRLLEVEGPATPGRVLLLDPAAGTVRELFRRRPWLEPTRLVRAAEVHYPARDGRVVPALLIHRRGPGAVPAPAVVVPPREPWEPDPWGFDPLAQLLADRGYAVLQPAPRGSAGWGRHHLEAGRGQWGAGMLDDLADGVRWLIEQGIADPDRVAIVGAGWGGYAAVASLAFTPDLYAAGVAVGGPVDLVAFVEAVPDADHRRRGLLRRLVGDPMDPVQRERLRRQSPLGFAGAIRAPLLRVERQGEGAMGGDRLVAVLEGLGRPLQALTVAGGRGRLEGSEGVAVAAAVEGFLGAHLGGRVERAGLRPAGAAP